MAESVRSSQGNGAPSRHEKSLGLLTIKFVSLLQEAKDGVLDLKVAADSLAVRQKRRIYDITNVLEGVGLIEKKTKNIIQWRGENMGSQTPEVQGQVEVLKAQIAELEAQEKELDSQKICLEQSVKHMSDNPISSRYPCNINKRLFVTHEDICEAFRGDTLLAVIAPSGTELEVPLPEMGPNGQKKYQVNLRSELAPIQVMLINRESDSSKPLVFSVPPTEDISSMPTPPTTPAGRVRFPLPSSTLSSSTFSSTTLSSTILSSSASSSQDSICSDHKMVLPEHDDAFTPSSTPPDIHMECQTHPEPVELEHQTVVTQEHAGMGGPGFQSMLDVSSLLKLNTSADHIKDEREGVADLIDELMSSDVFPLLRLSPYAGVDYNFNLDDNEGVCDLFDVQILNY
ncbi:transcription factor E2F5 [Aplochiton taeniatus]